MIFLLISYVLLISIWSFYWSPTSYLSLYDLSTDLLRPTYLYMILMLISHVLLISVWFLCWSPTSYLSLYDLYADLLRSTYLYMIFMLISYVLLISIWSLCWSPTFYLFLGVFSADLQQPSYLSVIFLLISYALLISVWSLLIYVLLISVWSFCWSPMSYLSLCDLSADLLCPTYLCVIFLLITYFLATSTCLLDQFTCTDGSCVPLIDKCDGIADCTDASDEVHCGMCCEYYQCSQISCYKCPRICYDRCYLEKGHWKVIVSYSRDNFIFQNFLNGKHTWLQTHVVHSVHASRYFHQPFHFCMACVFKKADQKP